MGFVLPSRRELRGLDADALREELGPDELERATAEGERMGVGEAVACALAFAGRHA